MTESLPRVTYANAAGDFSALHAFIDASIHELPARHLGAHRPNHIGGRDDLAGHAYAVYSPIDSSILLGSMLATDAAGVDRAVQAASGAWPAWRKTPWTERVACLRRAAQAIRARRIEIGMGLVYEVGKSRLEAMGEVEESIDLIEFYCAEVERNDGWLLALRPGSATETGSDRLLPYGVFAVISPFNFPLALAVGMTCGALLGGNTVVWKPSPGAWSSARELLAAYEAAGLPPGVFNMIAGDRETGALLVAHPDIAGVAFTGSQAVGMSILAGMAQGAYFRPVLAELGGKNATYVTSHADLDAAAQGVARSAFGLSGQKCSSCSRVFVQRDVQQVFLDKLFEVANRMKVGDPRHASVFTGPVIDARAGDRFDEAVAAARRDGRVLFGGVRLAGAEFARGAYVEPTVVAALAADHPLHQRELFLPFLTVSVFDELSAALDEGNRSSLGLTAGLYSRDEAEQALWFDRIEAGVLYVNRASGATTGAWPGFQTFAGWKGSGISGKGGLGTFYVPQFMREQSRTIAAG